MELQKVRKKWIKGSLSNKETGILKSKEYLKIINYLHLKIVHYKPDMARITVEDCIDKFPSRFELVLVASNRARKLSSGENPTVEIDNDKNTVIALREIADETLSSDQLKNDLIQEYQTNTFTEDEEINEIEDNSNEDKPESDETIFNEEQKDDEKETLNTEEIQNNETSQDNLEILSDENKAQDL